MTSPPTILTNGAMTTNEGCASIADAAGNLLFYTSGSTIYNQTHATMANGTGLTGNSSTTQSAIIVKQPGNTNIYFVFTLGVSGVGTLNYSIVDMTLASGNGSVTVKNTLLSSGMTEKLTSVKHCNGTDIWVIAHDNNSANFRCFLVTSTGVNSTAIVTSIGMTHSSTNTSWLGNMKASPNGKKLGLAISGSSGTFELFDFDNSTGVVSNSLNLGSYVNAYGCEFSPDGTKFYGDRESGTNYLNLYQWDLCAGSPTAIIASQFTIAVTSQIMGMQLANDGKIYIARLGQSTIAVIGSPNVAGSGCSYNHTGQSVSPKTSAYNLPNFMTSYLKPPSPPFTFTVNNSYGCQGAAFTMPPTVNTSTMFGCIASGYSVTGQTWIFGDPASGANNISFLSNPIHAYSALGTYTAMLVINYSCGGGTDTIKSQIVINQPCITVTSTSITCASLGSATVVATGGVGPYSYTWMPGSQASSVATGLSPGSYTLTVHDFGNNFTYTATTLFTSLIPLTGNVNNAGSVSCNGASTASANVTNIAGGSGTVSYVWYNTTTSYSTPTVLLGAGIWSVTVTDVLTGCQIRDLFYISQPPALNLVMSSNTPTACAGGSINLTGLTSGGTPRQLGGAYTYTWIAGPLSPSRTVSQSLAGTYVYNLWSKDSLNCLISGTISVDFIANPTITVGSVSICPLATGTLLASGASSYTWNANPALTGPTFTASPLVATQYSVLGSALSCTGTAVGSVLLKGVPIALMNSNSPVCNGQNLNLFGNGGVSYQWTGPLGYSSSLQYPVINLAAPNNSGVYNVTVTAANSCTAQVQKTITVNPSPTLSALGSTVCVTQTLNLYASSFAGSGFLWSGPGSFSSALQNPYINNPGVSASGSYTVKVTSAAGCTNMATADVTVTALPLVTITSTSPKCYGTALSFTAGTAVAVSYQWNGPNGFSSALQSPAINFVTAASAGVYSLQVSRGPCVNSATHSVVIYPLPVFTPTSNSPVCETKKLNLHVGPLANAQSYVWQGPGFYSGGNDQQRDSCMLSFGGIYTLTVSDTNGCQDTRTLAVNIYTNPILSTQSTTVCLNGQATLKVSGASTYQWQGPGPEFYSSGQQNAVIRRASSSVPVIYTVTGYAGNSCSSRATASLSTYALPLPSLQVSPANRVCLNKVFVMQGFGAVGYEWYGPNKLYYAGQSVSVTASSPVYAGEYTLVVSDERGCQSSTRTAMIIDPLPVGSMGVSRAKSCVPFESYFTFSAPAQSYSTIIASWVISTATSSPASFSTKSFSTGFTSPGHYTLSGQLTDTIHYCSNTLSLVVEAYPVPKADFEFEPKDPVEDQEVFFTNTSKGEEQSSWSWFFKAGPVVDSSGRQHPVYMYRESGTYPIALVVRNSWGCSDSVVKLIVVEPDLTLYIPNVFSPNEDGRNDIFLPVLRGIKLYNLSIFNRWGTKLFETSDIHQGWAGLFNGLPCPADTYVWKMSFSAINGQMKTLTGYVLLNR